MQRFSFPQKPLKSLVFTETTRQLGSECQQNMDMFFYLIFAIFNCFLMFGFKIIPLSAILSVRVYGSGRASFEFGSRAKSGATEPLLEELKNPPKTKKASKS